MAVVCHPNHRSARRRLVMPADLNGERFIAFDRALPIRKAIDGALRQHGAKANIVMEFDNIETIKQAIIIAAGVSVLPRHTVEKEAGIRTLATVPLGVPDLARPVGIIYRRGKPLTPTASRFVEMLKEASAVPAQVAAGERGALMAEPQPPAKRADEEEVVMMEVDDRAHDIEDELQQVR